MKIFTFRKSSVFESSSTMYPTICSLVLTIELYIRATPGISEGTTGSPREDFPMNLTYTLPDSPTGILVFDDSSIESSPPMICP